MTISDDIKAYHSNVEVYGLKYPADAEYPESIVLTPQESHIPVEVYTSEAQLDLEFKQIWYSMWQVACRTEEVDKPGDYLEYVIGDQSFLIVRGEDGQLRAFQNACRHRGTLLKHGIGNAKDIKCSFHAWCWSLKGELQDIPDRQLFPGVTDEEYALPEVGCDTWGGWVFIHPKPEGAPTLREFLARTATDLEPYHMDRYRATMHARIPLECNWKVALEAFLEAYHVSSTHPQITPYLDDVNTLHTTFGDHSRMIVPYGVPSMRLEHVDEAEIYEAYFSRSATAFRHSEAAKATGQSVSDLPPELFDKDGEWIGEGTMRDYLIRRAQETGAKLGHDYSGLTREQMIDDYDYHVFPSLKFNSHAGGALGFVSRPHPTDPNKCFFDVYTLVWPDENAAPPEPAPLLEIDITQQSMGTVLDQDFDNLWKVQKGLHNSSLKHVTFGSSEVRVAHFHTVLNRYLQEPVQSSK
ncbi:aromatic ring-hydroxylating oxygenase subunit alpha [Arthrobacter nitrophenolicus]|uniref:Phenylpropionate dioxygenase-like ring-hydroxylating dioxygenase large terminal subunit n=2 Tax=Arthrobacter nitrophenolicus TaxID=683150 RepID=A0ACC6TL98_9MICC|nr:aromatic ring-hydroxylating dioxygenase subunit alpha [Arthrobacter nitrophenolicus]ELT42770.1 Rieske (2Fe-2S) domain-containing protein [Arthrobacter nitrophenolicus]